MAADSAYRWLSKLPALTLLEVEWVDAFAMLAPISADERFPAPHQTTCGYFHGVTGGELEIVRTQGCDERAHPRDDPYSIPLGCLRAVRVAKPGKPTGFTVTVRVVSKAR